MASKRELEIIATFKDLVSKRLQGLQGAVIKASGSIRQMGDHLKKSGQQLAEFGQKAAFVGAAITGPLALAFRNAEKYSFGVSNEMERLKNITTSFQVSVANAMIPVVHKLTNTLGALLNAWNSLSPATQQAIIQGTLVVGLFFTIGGAVTILIGKLISLGGIIISVVGRFATIAAANPYILGITLAVLGLIYVFQKLGITTKDVLNFIEIAFKSLAIVASETFRGVTIILDNILKYYDAVLGVLSKLPGFIGKINSSISSGVRTIRGDLQGLIKDSGSLSQDLAVDVANIMNTGQGSLSAGFDSVVTKLKEFYELMRNPPEFNPQPIIEKVTFLRDAVGQVVQSMQQNFGDAIFKIFTGDLKNIQQVFANFGREILQILSHVIAKMILMKTIGAIGLPGGGTLAQFFHTGGIVRRAHTGMLAHDEVPIIAQAGEGIISRRGMGQLGASNLSRLNRGAMIGGGGGNTTIQSVLVVKAFDVADIMRNKGQIENIISNSITRNGSVRKAIKQNG